MDTRLNDVRFIFVGRTRDAVAVPRPADTLARALARSNNYEKSLHRRPTTPHGPRMTSPEPSVVLGPGEINRNAIVTIKT